MADVEMVDAITAHARPQSNPDAQAIVSDFVDYTEFFPSDLLRSLTLIGNLDGRFKDAAAKVHELTKVYGHLPDIPAEERPDPRLLRKEISAALDNALNSRLSAFSEAERLYEVTQRHCHRLATIKRKLQALPEPPSRDPTPPPVSPQTARNRRMEADRLPRLTINMDRTSRTSMHRSTGRSRRVTIPGEVLPPPNPDSPPPSTISDWEDSPPGSPFDMRGSRIDEHGRGRRGGNMGRIKIKPFKSQKLKVPRVRPPGVMGTNVHSQVAGISTSNALAQLSPPPPDAKPGSKFAPWFRLTDYEMAVLRKKMKKNAIWSPSDTMIRRELARHGRGRENYEKAKAHAEATGEPFLDEEPLDPAKKTLGPGESSLDAWSKEDTQLVNRGMKLNEAKKLKKENMAREQAARDLLEIEEASRKIVETGSMFKNLFDNATPTTPTSGMPIPPTSSEKKRDPIRGFNNRKRKRDSTPDIAETTESGFFSEPPQSPEDPIISLHSEHMQRSPHQSPIRLKTSPSLDFLGLSASPSLKTTTTVTQVPLAPAGPGTPATAPNSRRPTPGLSSPSDNKRFNLSASMVATAAASRSRRQSIAPKPGSPDATSPLQQTILTLTNRPRSRGGGSMKAASAEPPGKYDRRDLRRGSNASLPAASDATQSVRTSARTHRKPAPAGMLTSEEGGTKVASTVRKRGQKGGRRQRPGMEDGPSLEDVPEDFDPNEPRYCLCGDVSWGTMVACENDNCDKEWFHLDCVGLTEIPPRRSKWFCPECREKMNIDEKGHPLSIVAGFKRGSRI